MKMPAGRRVDAERDAALFHQQFAFPQESRKTKHVEIITSKDKVKVGACRLHPVKWSDGLTVEEYSQE
jgi:hypothetical protein